MLNPMTPVRRTRDFARKHKTTISYVTAVATTAYVYHQYMSVEVDALRDELELVNLRETVLRKFVSDKGLKDEFLNEYLPSL